MQKKKLKEKNFFSRIRKTWLYYNSCIRIAEQIPKTVLNINTHIFVYIFIIPKYLNNIFVY